MRGLDNIDTKGLDSHLWRESKPQPAETGF